MKKLFRLKNRIKRNEGFRESCYRDSLGFLTIGYGHLIKKNESYFLKNNYTKKKLNEVFEIDFEIALISYLKTYKKENHSKYTKELLIEMIFQLGIKGQRKFIKMNRHLNKKNFFMAALEMKSSLWYKQTPKRVNSLIKVLLKNKND